MKLLLAWMLMSVVVGESIYTKYLGQDMAIENVDCINEECLDTKYCIGTIPLYSKDFSQMWGTSNVHISFPESFSSNDKCIKVETEDTYLRHTFFGSSVEFYDVADFQFSNFGQSCFTYCGKRLNVHLYMTLDRTNVFQLNFFIALILGILLFQGARFFSDKILFYYLSGVTLGIFLSVLFLVSFLFGSFLPKRTTFFIATTVQSLMLYFYNNLKVYITNLVENNFEYVVYYFMITVSMSLAVTHYLLKKDTLNPEVSSGLKDIVYILIKLIGVVLIYNASASVIRSLSVIIIIFLFNVLKLINVNVASLFDSNVPKLTADKLYRDRFITQDEYRMQGQIATAQSLDALVSSPAFGRWARQNKSRIRVDAFE